MVVLGAQGTVTEGGVNPPDAIALIAKTDNLGNTDSLERGNSSVLIGQPDTSVFSIFPNPSNGVITLRGAADAVTITNVSGEEVLRTEYRVPTESDFTLDLSRLSAGTYFVRLETADGMVVRKILKE